MIDHIGIPVRDYEKSKEFYRGALAPLGYELIMEFEEEGWAGFGTPGNPDFWIHRESAPAPRVHVALAASNRILVTQYHEAALRAGGTDNGGPGLRSEYHPHYYAAFVLDPDGHNIEVVCHEPEGAAGDVIPASAT